MPPVSAHERLVACHLGIPPHKDRDYKEYCGDKQRYDHDLQVVHLRLPRQIAGHERREKSFFLRRIVRKLAVGARHFVRPV